VAAETALLGSIGVVMAVRDPRRDKGKDIEFVSSVSPNKRPDPTTPSGQDQYQALVDQLGDIFVAAVARNRGVKPQAVLDDFGAGGLLVGAQAVEAGMADAHRLFRGHAGRDAGTAPARREGRRAQAATGRRNGAGPDHGVGRPARGGRMGMRERFFAWLDGMDVEASADDDRAGGTADGRAAHRHRPTAGTHPDRRRSRRPTTVSSSACGPRWRPSEATIVRLRDERIAAEALAFADAAVRDEKARPAEREAIIAAYTRAALDDAT
jgi:hypothetical protein